MLGLRPFVAKCLVGMVGIVEEVVYIKVCALCHAILQAGKRSWTIIAATHPYEL